MKIAVFLPGWVGDVVMATPAIRALRQQFAGARLLGVHKPYVAGVLEGSTWFDRLVPLNGNSWKQGMTATAWQLRQEGVDLAVLFPNSFRAAMVAWLGGCKRIVGYVRYGRGPLLTDALEPERQPDGRIRVSPIVTAYNRLVEVVGCPSPGHDLELFTTEADERAVDGVWAAAGYASYPEVICLNPGAAFGAAKHWPNEYFARLAADLVDRRGCGVLVTCGPSERGQAAEIVARAGRLPVHSLGELATTAGVSLSLGLTKGCIRRADLLVTADSGPRHFAHAFDRPVVTLFGPTHIAWTETYHPRAVHLQRPVPCGPCQQRVCPLGHHQCMKDLLPGEVIQAAEALLQGDS
ncbi:MAG: lipopolysaccharide heptosyltransferase II [Gemmataceae bacterium]